MPDSATVPDIDSADLESAPVERAETIPSSWYTDPRFHRGRFSVRFEAGVYHFQQLLKQAYRDRLATP